MFDRCITCNNKNLRKIIAQFEFVPFTWKSVNKVFSILNAIRETQAILNLYLPSPALHYFHVLFLLVVLIISPTTVPFLINLPPV